MPDIDYRLRLLVDPRRRRVRISGAHDGFLSYSVLIDGRTVYDYEQNLFEESYSHLLGTGDVIIERTVDF